LSNLTENRCITSLIARHRKDLFFSHVPINLKSTRILDAFALSRSHVFLSTGYEIKLSHSDFVNDDKWIEYLPFCSRFFFVSPIKVIKQEEIPEETGLIYIREDGITHKIKNCISKPVQFDKLAEFFFTLLVYHTDNSLSVQRLQRIFEMSVLMVSKKAGENLSKIIKSKIRSIIFSLQNQCCDSY